jgi:hypothetical protein
MRSTVIAALLASGLKPELLVGESKQTNWRHQRPPEVTRVPMRVDPPRPEQGSREKQRRLRQLKKQEQKA